jgi:hypothetical protein
VYSDSSGRVRSALDARLEQSLAAERELLQLASGEHGDPRRAARIHFDPREVRVRSSEERVRIRRERAAQRARANLFRPR